MSERVCHTLLVVFFLGVLLGLARTGWWVVMHL